MGSTPGCRQLGADVAGIHSPEQVKERGAKAEGSLVLGGGGGKWDQSAGASQLIFMTGLVLSCPLLEGRTW